MILDLFEQKEEHDSEQMGSSFVAAAPCQATEQQSVCKGWGDSVDLQYIVSSGK